MAARAPRGPGLGRGIVTLIAVDVVLVLTFIVLVLSLVLRGGADPEADGTPGPTPTDAATAGPEGTDPGPTPTETGFEQFALPSGNIACELDAERARCAIASFTYEPPAVEGCAGTVGHVIELTAAGASFTCETGEPPGQAGEDVPVLGYGEDTTTAGLTCSSSTAGVLCRNATGSGFTLARAGFDLFD